MSEFLNIEGLALERGERPDIVARMLVHNGGNLYLWFGELKDRYGYMVFPGHPFDRREYKISPGYYPLTKESQEEFIKRLERGETTTEGLTMLDTWQLDPTTEQKFTIEYPEHDDSVYVCVNLDDVAKLPPPSPIEDTAVTRPPTNPKRKFSKISPISIFIDEQISNGTYEWQKAWSELWGNIAQNKNTKIEDLKLYSFGEKDAFVRRNLKYTSNKLDLAIEYQEDSIPTFKTVTRQSFGRMFRRSLKKSRTPSDSPK
jgi:hypothetical protein